MRPEFDPTHWVDEWPIPELSADDRKRIKAALLAAHAVFLRADIRQGFSFIASMEQAFGGIAKVLFDAGLLNDNFLGGQLRFLIVESAVRFGWVTVPKDEPLVEAFPGYFGHASSWLDFNSRFQVVFGAEVAEWRAKLLEREVEDARVRRPSQSLPGATILGGDINDYVAWDGEHYVLRQTKDSILSDKSLRLIGSVKELSRNSQMGPGRVTVIPSEPHKCDPSSKDRAALSATGSIIDSRKNLLVEYKSAVGGTSNKSIYEARNSGIHKAEFYQWQHGELPDKSATTANFERFLREKKPPIPRKPKP
jgi:hypothetical protein